MPTYELVCKACGHEIKFKDKMNSTLRKEQKCPECDCEEFMEQKITGGELFMFPRWANIKDE